LGRGETVPKFISKSDPAAQWTGARKGHAFFAYADNYLIDLKAAIFIDVEATRAIRQAEVGAARAALLHRASKHDCDACELKPRCRPKCLPARSAFSPRKSPRRCARYREDRRLCQVAP
jgi:hypothetical protein